MPQPDRAPDVCPGDRAREWPAIRTSAARCRGSAARRRAAGRRRGPRRCRRSTASATTTTLNTGVKFDDVTVTPRNPVTGTLDARIGVFTRPRRWARRAQAVEARGGRAQRRRGQRVRPRSPRADAFPAIIARRQVVGRNLRARDTAQAHFDLRHTSSCSRASAAA